MREQVNERVGVLATFGEGPRGSVEVRPQVLVWRGRRYRLNRFGMHHPERRGTKRIHVFSFSAGEEEASFRVELDPETLAWTLVEVHYESGA
jgi:hypothetical protein